MSLRELLHGSNDCLKPENYYVWKNVEINLHNNDIVAFRSMSGNGCNEYIALFNE